MLSESGFTFLKLLCNKYFSGSEDSLQKIVDETFFDELTKVPHSSDDPNILLFHNESLILSMHYSWIKPIIHEIPESLRPIIINALPQNIREKLKDENSSKSVDYTAPVKDFLLGELFSHWNDNNVLPKELISETKLSPLLNCTKSQLVDIVSLLSIHDLVDEVRQIVEKKLLKNVIGPLTKKQQSYLKVCLHQKQQITVEPLKVQKLCEDRTKYMKELHIRGIKRLASGLSRQDKNFIWYITHTLDIGRGKILEKCMTKTENETILNIVEVQILSVLQFLKTEK